MLTIIPPPVLVFVVVVFRINHLCAVKKKKTAVSKSFPHLNLYQLVCRYMRLFVASACTAMPTQLWEVKCWLFTKYLELPGFAKTVNKWTENMDVGSDVRVPLSHLNTGLALLACKDSHFSAWLVQRYHC